MLQQPLARRVAGAARYAAAGEALPGALSLSVCGVAHEACELQPLQPSRCMPRRFAARN